MRGFAFLLVKHELRCAFHPIIQASYATHAMGAICAVVSSHRGFSQYPQIHSAPRNAQQAGSCPAVSLRMQSKPSSKAVLTLSADQLCKLLFCETSSCEVVDQYDLDEEGKDIRRFLLQRCAAEFGIELRAEADLPPYVREAFGRLAMLLTESALDALPDDMDSEDLRRYDAACREGE